MIARWIGSIAAICTTFALAHALTAAQAETEHYTCRQLHDEYAREFALADSYYKAEGSGNKSTARRLITAYFSLLSKFDLGRVPSNMNDANCDDETIFLQDESRLVSSMMLLGTQTRYMDHEDGMFIPVEQKRSSENLESAYLFLAGFVRDYETTFAKERYGLLLGYARRLNAWCKEEHFSCYDSDAWSYLASWPNEPAKANDGIHMFVPVAPF